MDPKQIEKLHEEASEHYLNGRFADALKVWRDLLDENPEDQRAQEGLRLAGLLVEGPDEAPDEAPTPVAAEAAGSPDSPTTEHATPNPLVGVPTAAPDPAADVATPPPPHATAQPAGDIDDFDLDLSALDSLKMPSEEPASPPPPAAGKPVSGPAQVTDLPDPTRQNDGIDFGDVSETATVPLAAEVPRDEPRRGFHAAAGTASEDDSAVDLPDLEPMELDPTDPEPGAARLDPPIPGEPADEADPPGSGEAPDPVEDQLRKRVQDLLDEAKEASAEGRADDALGILSRVAILDEENEEARKLDEQIRGEMGMATQEIDHWMAEGVQWLEEGRLDEARERFEKVLGRVPGHGEALVYLEKLDRAGEESSPEEPPLTAPEVAPTPPVAPEVDASPVSEPEPEGVALAQPAPEPTPEPALPDSLAPAETPVPVAAAPTRKRFRPATLMLVLVLVGGGAAVAGWLLFGMFGGDEPAGGAPLAAAGAAASGTVALPSSTAEEALPEPPPEAGSALSPADRAERVQEAMIRATEAHQRGEWEAAILAYNEWLAIDPTNSEAAAGLFEAGERYREVQAVLEQLRKADVAFQDGEYSAALRIFYRLPENSVDPAALDRYKINGWYNLGVVALRAGDTETAISHFDEVLQIEPDEPDGKALRALAERYDRGIKDRAYYATVDALEFRALDD